MTIPKPQKCLSVVMPCHNELETIEECLTNVLLSPWVLEVIFADDGSNDGTRDVLAKMDDERLKVYLQPRNEGKEVLLKYQGLSRSTGIISSILTTGASRPNHRRLITRLKFLEVLGSQEALGQTQTGLEPHKKQKSSSLLVMSF